MAKLFTTNQFFLLVLAVLFLTAFAADSVVNGQGSRQIYIERRIDTMNRQAKEFERDSMARDGSKNDAEAAKRTRQIRIEIEEDLRSLQDAYNSAVTIIQTNREMRPDFVAETARSVRKHALRLKANLSLPKPEEKAEKVILPDTDRKVLTAMCRSIYEFITNPIFETAGLDAKNSSKARHDLDAIVYLAESLFSAAPDR